MDDFTYEKTFRSFFFLVQMLRSEQLLICISPSPGEGPTYLIEILIICFILEHF